MTQTIIQSVITIGIVAVVTYITRCVPFILFSKNKETPKPVIFLGKVLPFAIIGMLVVFCLKNVSVFSFPNGLPELISIACIVILHKWKHNMLLSIGGGTVVYMVLVQMVFK